LPTGCRQSLWSSSCGLPVAPAATSTVPYSKTRHQRPSRAMPVAMLQLRAPLPLGSRAGRVTRTPRTVLTSAARTSLARAPHSPSPRFTHHTTRTTGPLPAPVGVPATQVRVPPAQLFQKSIGGLRHLSPNEQRRASRCRRYQRVDLHNPGTARIGFAHGAPFSTLMARNGANRRRCVSGVLGWARKMQWFGFVLACRPTGIRCRKRASKMDHWDPCARES